MRTHGWAGEWNDESMPPAPVAGDATDPSGADVSGPFTYDAAGELVGAEPSPADPEGTEVGYHYDGWGNYLGQTIGGRAEKSTPLTTDGPALARLSLVDGDWEAATDLVYHQARCYDPSCGRWLSQEPLGDDAGNANLSRPVTNAPAQVDGSERRA